MIVQWQNRKRGKLQVPPSTSFSLTCLYRNISVFQRKWDWRVAKITSSLRALWRAQDGLICICLPRWPKQKTSLYSSSKLKTHGQFKPLRVVVFMNSLLTVGHYLDQQFICHVNPIMHSVEAKPAFPDPTL